MENPTGASNRVYRPEESRQEDPGAISKRHEDLRLEFVCEDAGLHSERRIVLRATKGDIWPGHPDGELRLNLVNPTGQQFFQPGQRYQLAFTPIMTPVAAAAGSGESARDREVGGLL